LIRVAIFEDNKHLRETFQLLLENTAGYVCAGAWSNCNELEEAVKKSSCDIVLMDIEMPGMNGIEATKVIKAKFPDVLVLIQTVFAQDDYIFNAICAGASGYILKSATPQEYLSAIQDVHNGGSPMTGGIARRVLELFKHKLGPQSNTDKYDLTNQERRVLQQLVEGKSYKLAADALYISFDTVKTHVRNIYAKLQVHSGTEAVSKAIRERLFG
jgi:DNA-binding NarL/FixJ family response regulator